VVAADSRGHALTYAWSGVWPGLTGSGAFVPGGTVAAPSWHAPANQTETPDICTFEVAITDGHGQSAVSSTTVLVAPANRITLTGAAGSTPNPVASSGTATVDVNATNSFNLPLAYAWSAVCPGLPGNGSFAAPTARTTTWTAPANTTTVMQACTMQVVVSDGEGVSLPASFTQDVRPLNTLTITETVHATPNPVPSSGTSALSVTVSDTLGLPLTYSWSSVCPTLATNGTFSSVTAPDPIWTAPANLTGVAHTCTISVTISDGQDQSVTLTFPIVVSSVPQVISVTGPSGVPNPVVSGGAVTATVAATDTLGRPLTYAWTSVCAPGLGSNGTFTAAASTSTTWTAPVNTTGGAATCTLSVTVADDLGNAVGRTLIEVVGTVPVIVLSPTGHGPSGAGPGSSVGLSVVGPDLPGQTLTYHWTSSCPTLAGNGSFDSTTSPTPVWTAPFNYTGVAQPCTLTVLISDGQGQTQTASFVVMVAPVDCQYTIAGPSDPLPREGGLVTFTVTATAACPWNASSTGPWAVVNGPASGAGNGSFTVTVGATSDPEPRSATIAAGSAAATLQQQGRGYLYFLAEGATLNGFFETQIALLNYDAVRSASVEVQFQLKDSGNVLTHTLSIDPHQRATISVRQLAQDVPALAELSSAEFSTVVRSTTPLVVDRTMSWDASGYGGHAETSIDAPSSTWYLAEGATLGAFELYYLIQNPNTSPLDNEIEVTYLLPPPAAPIVRRYSMGANTRRNIAVHLEPGLEDVEVSAVIRTPSGKPVIVERAMYLSTGGLFYGAGHESVGIRETNRQWFFAEGATGDFFDLFILIGNPGDEPARVTATFQFVDGITCSTRIGNTQPDPELLVGPKSRQNIWVNLLQIPGCPHDLADAAVATTITSDVPIVAERAMWWGRPQETWWEAHNSAGFTTTGVKWGLAEGAQGLGVAVETYVLIANTSDYDGTARVTLYFEDGSTTERIVELVRQARTTVAVGVPPDLERQGAGLPERTGSGFGAVTADRRFGIVVESLPVPGREGPARIVVERSMYWSGPGAAEWAAGTNAVASKIQ
jgi:hypothetical protein